MRITVIIPSRGRISGLTTILNSLMAMESGEHQIHYGVCCDDDDIATNMLCNTYRLEHPHRFAYRMGPRPRSLGGVINDMALRMPSDAYVMLSDHCICLTPGWDKAIAEAVEETPHGIFFWTSADPKVDVHFCIVTERWREAAGQVMSEDYPFWFDDLALLELYPMATGKGAAHLDIKVFFKGEKTHRMRELKFWRDFFVFNRAFRVEKGKHIAANLGLPVPQFGEAFAEALRKMLPDAPDEHLDYLMERQGDLGEPDSSYLEAKARAMQIMGMQ